MRVRRTASTITFGALLAARLLAPAGDLLLCVAPGGHVAVERGTVSCDDASPRTAGDSGPRLAPSDAHCGPCTDIPLVLSQRDFAAKRTTGHGAVHAPAVSAVALWVQGIGCDLIPALRLRSDASGPPATARAPVLRL